MNKTTSPSEECRFAALVCKMFLRKKIQKKMFHSVKSLLFGSKKEKKSKWLCENITIIVVLTTSNIIVLFSILFLCVRVLFPPQAEQLKYLINIFPNFASSQWFEGRQICNLPLH